MRYTLINRSHVTRERSWFQLDSATDLPPEPNLTTVSILTLQGQLKARPKQEVVQVQICTHFDAKLKVFVTADVPCSHRLVQRLTGPLFPSTF